MAFTKKQKISLICLSIWGVILVAIGIAMPFILESVMKKEAREQAVMTDSNANMWAVVPGKTQTTIRRKFSLYNFTNPDEVLFLNKTPELVEYGPYIYQELQKLDDLNFSKNGSSVKYNNWVYEHIMNEGRDVNEKISSVNFGAFGVWNQLKDTVKTPDSTLLLQAFGQLITGLQTQITENILAQALKEIFYAQKADTIAIFEKIGVDSNTSRALWNDPFYGFATIGTLAPWIVASRSGVKSSSATLLQAHFRLPFDQLYNILEGTLKSSIDGIKQLAENNYCALVTQDLCNGDYFAAVQWATQNITINPPGGIGPTPSIAASNISAKGFPEISYYYKEVFLKNINNTASYQNITFCPKWAYKRLQVSKDPKKWLTDPSLFLHIGNLQFLWATGEKFDQSQKLEDLQPIVERFEMQSLYHAHVLWEYLKYMLYDFAMHTKQGGNRVNLGGGAFSSQGLYSAYVAVKDELLSNVTGALWLANNKNKSCSDIMNASISGLSQESLNSLCAKPIDISFLKYVTEVCDTDYSNENKNFLNKFNLTHLQVLQLCDTTSSKNSLISSLAEVQEKIYNHYKCTGLKMRCTREEIAVMQFANSNITENIFPEIEDVIPKRSNFYNGKPYEIKDFKKRYQEYFKNNDTNGVSYKDALKLLTFDSLFSAVMDGQALTAFENKNFTFLNEIYPGFKGDEIVLISYIKKMGIDWFLGGFSTTRPAKDFILGYEIPLLKTLSEVDPATGGNPSIPTFMGFSVNNTKNDSLKFPMSMYTGKSDYKLTRSYKTIFGKNYITNNISSFNGNVTEWNLENPWNGKVAFKGSDGFQNSPNLNPDERVNIYITDLFRGAYILKISDGDTYSGLSTWRYNMPMTVLANETNNPDNVAFYAKKYNGIMNLTSVFNAPIFVSKRYFYGGDKELFDSIKLYKTPNKTGSNMIHQSSDDELIIDCEPYSGAMIYATEKLQFALQFEGDSYFTFNKTAFIPVLNMNREGQMGDSAVIFYSYFRLMKSLEH